MREGERYALVRRDAQGRELDRIPMRAAPPASYSRRAWAMHVASVQTRTLRALAGEDAGAWHAEREGDS